MMAKFTTAEVTSVRLQLLEGTPDPFETAEILRAFLIDRGYGVSSAGVLDAASRVGAAGCSFAAVQAGLEAVALIM